jgi:hypothetical protein
MMAWSFEETSPRYRDRNPISDEFFVNDSVLSDLDALVRESLQNSLDAGIGGAPVRVKFSFGHLESDKVDYWFGSLAPHINAALGAETSSLISGKSRYLLVEDFQTTGLRGHPEMQLEEAKQKGGGEASYYFFVHAEGESPKGGGTRGTWGIGKTVFQKLSMIRSFFIYSERGAGQTPETVAIGQSLLNLHTLNGKSYIPDGWYSNQVESGLHTPIDEPESVRLAEDFNLQRMNGETGLSIVVPFIPQEVSASALSRSICSEYFIPILTGDLVCEIQDGSWTKTLDSASLLEDLRADVEENQNSREMTSLLESTELLAASVGGSTQVFDVRLPSGSSKAADLVIDEELSRELGAALQNGYICEVRVTLDVPTPGSNQAVTDCFRIILKRNNLRSRVRFSRQGILVPQQQGVFLNQHSALVLFDAGPLADLLSRAEGPAHSTWSDQAKKFKLAFGTSTFANQRIAIVRGLATQLEREVQSLDGVIELNLFSEFFSHFGTGGTSKTSGNAQPGGNSGKPPPPKPPVNSIDDKYQVVERDGGFRVIPAAASDNKLTGRVLRISVAYKVARGNSFTKWESNDFVLENMRVSENGIETKSLSGNTTVIKVVDEDFSYQIEGFDTSLRDIEVAISEVAL